MPKRILGSRGYAILAKVEQAYASKILLPLWIGSILLIAIATLVWPHTKVTEILWATGGTLLPALFGFWCALTGLGIFWALALIVRHRDSEWTLVMVVLRLLAIAVGIVLTWGGWMLTSIAFGWR